ncbi:MAG: isopentenyl phosphate kinase [Anaerolineae bacterium]
MLTFIKLGGSLITDKRVEASFRAEVMARLAQEIAAAYTAANPLVIGHGSGSFGHFAASRYGTMQGVATSEQWRGFAEVATVAAELNYLVAHTLHQARVPVWRFQPSASARCRDGLLYEMALYPIQQALAHGLVPLVYGDVALDDVRGGTIISTEVVLSYLADHLPVTRILLLGEVDGVYDESGVVISEIHPGNVDMYQAALGGSGGTDVTGGMLTKVHDMLTLVQRVPGLTIRILNGNIPDLLRAALVDEATPGTLIRP